MTYYITRKIIRKLPGKVIKAVKKPEPEIISGFGTRGKIGEICKRSGFARALIVTDTTVFSLGYHEKIAASLEENGIKYAVFSDISSEPTVSIVEAGRKAAVEAGAECLIALGGGSVLDSTKMIAAGLKFPKKPVRRLLKKFLFVRGGTYPMISVPSTAGTGAEITVGAVITRESKGKKGSTVVCGLNVIGVVLDNELTLKIPAKVTAACGIDALSHGLEGAVASVKVSAEDERKSMECVKLALENLGKLTDTPEDRDARLDMCVSALYGGNAINKQLAGYVHAFAHTIGAKYHVPHGNAIALSLLPVMDFQKGKCADKLKKLSVYCGLSEESDSPEFAAEKLLSAIGALIKKCGIDTDGSFIKSSDYGELASLIASDSINYSAPVVLKKKDIYKILDEIRGI